MTCAPCFFEAHITEGGGGGGSGGICPPPQKMFAFYMHSKGSQLFAPGNNICCIDSICSCFSTKLIIHVYSSLKLRGKLRLGGFPSFRTKP